MAPRGQLAAPAVTLCALPHSSSNTSGIVAARGHPLLGGAGAPEQLVNSPWIDFDAPATAPPGPHRLSRASLLERLHEATGDRVASGSISLDALRIRTLAEHWRSARV